MKRKTYSWLPSESNHMVKKPKPAARGSQPSTPINIEVASPVIDADAELEAELERELLASQQVTRSEAEGGYVRAPEGGAEGEADVMKLARETAKQKQREKAREERAVEERRDGG
jgi:hypothetical protein